MTKETLKRANEIDTEMKATRALLGSLLKAKKIKLTIESWDDDEVFSYGRDEFYLDKWMFEAMKQAAKEHEIELLRELDAL